MNLKHTLLVCLLLIANHFSSKAQLVAPNIDFETGTTSNWNYFRGRYTGGSTWALNTCTPAATLHGIATTSTTDPFGGFLTAGDGIYALKLAKDSPNNNADGASYNVHVPATGSHKLVYRYAIVFENPAGHGPADQPNFQVTTTDSATGAPLSCHSFSYAASASLPGFTHSSVSPYPWYLSWTARTLNLSGYGGRTIIINFKVGGCNLGGHWGYAYIDMSGNSLFKSSYSFCHGSSDTLVGPAGDSLYSWTDSATYTASYGSSQSIIVTPPTVPTTYAVIVTPFSGYGCRDTLYYHIDTALMRAHKSRDTIICAGSTVKIWGGVTHPALLTYTWSPSTGLSCSTCDTAFASPPVGTYSYKITTTNAAGCYRRDTVKVTVSPMPGTIGGVKSVCAGQTTLLTNGTSGGSWTTTATTISVGSTSGIVSGMAAGTGSVTYSFAGGCAAYTTVTVQPLPPAISGASTVCIGGSALLSNSAGPGTWSSSNTAIASVGSSSGIVAGIATGTSTITYTATSTTCFITHTITVTAAVGPITGTLTLCTGATSVLSNTTSGGSWSSSNPAVATVGSSSGSVSGTSVGTSVITYATGAGCISIATVTVSMTPSAIAGTTVVCAGSSTSLSNAATGGTWSSSDVTIATIGSSSGTATGVVAGTVTITYTSASGCGSVYVTLSVDPMPAAISGTLILYTGATTTLTDAVPGGTWASSDITVAPVGSTTGVVLGVLSGTATITYTIGSCPPVYTTVTVNPLPLATSGKTPTDKQQFILFPNPTNGQLNIQWLNQNTGKADVTITDVLGREVYKSVLNMNTMSGEKQIDLKGLNNGIYMISIKSELVQYNSKLRILK